MSNRYILLLLALFLIGCGSKTDPFKKTHTPESMMKRFVAPDLQTYKGFAKVSIQTAGRSMTFDQYIYIFPPNRIRLEGIDPVGMSVFVFIGDFSKLSFYIPSKKIMYYGPTTTLNIQRLVHMNTSITQLIALFTNQLIDLKTQTPAVKTDDRGIHLSYDTPKTSVLIDPNSAGWIKQRIISHPGREITALFEDFETVFNHDYPGRIMYTDTYNNTSVNMHIKKIIINSPVAPSVFNHLKGVPKNVKIVPLSEY